MKPIAHHKAFPFLVMGSVCVLWATLIWAIFHPGMLSADSLDQYEQALHLRFHDWHPPVMALVLALFIHSGLGLAALMWVQCVLFIMGCTTLAYAWLHDVPDERFRTSGALAVTAFILLVLPPALFYSMTLWKDAWLAILLLWSTVILRFSWDDPKGLSRSKALGLSLLVAALGLLRHNAVIVLPAFSIMMAWTAYRASGTWRRAGAIALAPLALWLVLHQALAHAPFVESRHPSRQVMELDLVGLCALDPDRRASLPHTGAHLRPHYQADYVPGRVRQLYWIENPIVDPAFLASSQFDPLREEYERALRRYPGALLHLKITAYAALLSGMPPEGWFHPFIDPNPHGLALHPRFDAVRVRLFDTAFTALRLPGLRWVVGSHLPWLFFGALMLARSLYRAIRIRSPHALFTAWCLSLPLLNALSFLPATVAHDFRFIYPSTLWLQIFFCSSVLRLMLTSINQRGSCIPASGTDASPSGPWTFRRNIPAGEPRLKGFCTRHQNQSV